MSNKLLLNSTNADIINEINKLKNSGSAGNAVLYTPQVLTEEQKKQVLKNIGLIKNQKPLKNGDVAPSTIYFDTSKDLEQWFTSLPYTKDGGGWDSYYIYGDWSSNVRFHVTQYDITQTDDNGTQILGHYYTLSYQKKDSNQIVIIYVSNDAIDSFFKTHEELMGLKLVKGWNTNILDTSAIAGVSLNLPDNSDFMYSESLAGSKELYLKNGVQVLTEEEKLQIQENIGLMKKGLKPIEIGDSLAAGAVSLDTSLNLDEWLASLTYDENYPIAPLYVCSLNITFPDEEPTTMEMPILMSVRNPLSDGSYCYMIMDAIAAEMGNSVGGTLYISSNASNEVLASVGATTTGWQMTEYNSMERLAIIGATVSSCIVTSVPEVGFAGIDGDFVEVYLTKKSQVLTEEEKLQIQENIGLMKSQEPLKNGDVAPSTIYLDTSKDIDVWLESLPYDSNNSYFIYGDSSSEIKFFFLKETKEITESDTVIGTLVYYSFTYINNNKFHGIYFSKNAPDDYFQFLEEWIGAKLVRGWNTDTLDLSAIAGATLNLPANCDFMYSEPITGSKEMYLKNGVQELTDAEKKQILMNLGLANLPLQIDSNLSSTSTNAVQNRAIYNYFSNYGSLNSSNNWLGNNTFKSIPYATNGYGVHNGTDEFNNTFYKHGKIEIAGDNPRTLTLPEKSGILATLDDIPASSGSDLLTSDNTWSGSNTFNGKTFTANCGNNITDMGSINLSSWKINLTASSGLSISGDVEAPSNKITAKTFLSGTSTFGTEITSQTIKQTYASASYTISPDTSITSGTYALKLPAKSGTIATLDDIQSGSGGTSFSGSYNDLTDKPDLDKFALSSMVETNINAIRTLTQPSFLKYISFNDTNEVIIALSQENKAVMSEWIATGNFVRPIYLWDVANKTYYPMTMATVSGVQYEIYFQKGSTLYIGIYDSENDSYGFSE